MNPQDNPKGQTPQQQPAPQPTQPAQPTPPTTQPVFTAENLNGLKPATTENNAKQLKWAWIIAIASPVVLLVALLFGYVFAATAIGSAYSASIGIRQKKVGLIVLGAIGAVAGLVLFIAAAISNM